MAKVKVKDLPHERMLEVAQEFQKLGIPPAMFLEMEVEHEE
jgi:hypothetical protein